MDYKTYQGQLTDTTPIVLEIEADLGIPTGVILLNDGPGAYNIKVKMAGNGEFTSIDPIPTASGDVFNLSGRLITALELTLQNDKYPAVYYVVASIGGDVGFIRNPIHQEVVPIPWYRTNELITTVQEYNGVTLDTTKINYVIPPNRVLYIESLTTSVDGCDNNAALVIQWEHSGSGFFAQGIGIGAVLPAGKTCGSDTNTFYAPDRNPLGPFVAGGTITAQRIIGDTGVLWAAHMLGYLEVV